MDYKLLTIKRGWIYILNYKSDIKRNTSISMQLPGN